MNGLYVDFHSHTLRPGALDAEQDIEDCLRAKLVDEIACGLIVCDGRGLVRFANCAAGAELASARVLYRRDDELRCAGAHGATLDAALRLTATKGRRQLLALGHDGDRLMVTLMPLHIDACPEPLVLIVLGRRGPCSELGLEMLSSAYGLTLTERRVLSGLMNDVAPRAIAAEQGVAISTVRSHISSIRAKLGVRSIEAILIRAAEVPQVPSALRFGGAARASLQGCSASLGLAA